MIDVSEINTPVGTLKIFTNPTALLKINFLINSQRDNRTFYNNRKYYAVTQQTLEELYEYFYLGRCSFNVNIKLNLSPFFTKVLKEVSKIKFGNTTTYKKIAKNLRNKNAARAVGMANAKNPIPIISPCHRVISVKNKIGGYLGGIKKTSLS